MSVAETVLANLLVVSNVVWATYFIGYRSKVREMSNGWDTQYTLFERIVRRLLRRPINSYSISYKDVGLDGIKVTAGQRIKLKKEEIK